MKRFSKLAALLIGAAMIFAFAGCADSVTDPVTNTDKTDSDYTLPAPANVKAAVSTKTVCAVTVTWDAINCDKKHNYYIYYSTKNDTSSLKESNVAVPWYFIYDGIGSYDVILPESGTYYFWVKATSGDYNTISSDFSEASNPVAFTFALDAPTNVKAALSSKKLNTVTLTWDAINCDKDHCYWIYCSTKNDTSSLKEPNGEICSYSIDGIGFYDVSLSESGTYYFWVKAAPSNYSVSTASSAFSKVSNSVSFTHQDLPVPTGFKVSAEGDRIELYWNSTKAPYYHIYINTENNSETATLYKSDIESINTDNTIEGINFIRHTTLTSGTTYYFWVKSADTSSSDSPTSGFSNVASCTYGSE